MARMSTITVAALYALIAKRGSTFASFTMEVDPSKDMRKTGNRFFGKVFKRSNIVANVGYNRVNKLTRIQARRDARTLGINWREIYETRVENGNMVAVGPRQWGEKVPGLPIVHHKGRVYIQLSVESASRPTYHWNDGSRLTLSEIAEMKTFMRDKPDEVIIHREYGIAGVRRVNLRGKRYRVEHSDAQHAEISANAQELLLVA